MYNAFKIIANTTIININDGGFFHKQMRHDLYNENS